MSNYFRNISDAFSTIFEGLAITASHMLRKPITIQYPDKTESPVQEMVAARYRGLLTVDKKICTGCLLCMQACPINCIDIAIAKKEQAAGSDGKPLPPVRLVSRFDIDSGLCMFCGFCVEVCPTGAIHFTREFEGATYNLDDLTFKFVKEGETFVPYKKGSVAESKN